MFSVYVHGIEKIEVHTSKKWRSYTAFRKTIGEIMRPAFEVVTNCKEVTELAIYSDICKVAKGYARPHCRASVQMLGEDLIIKRNDVVPMISFKDGDLEVLLMGEHADPIPMEWFMEGGKRV